MTVWEWLALVVVIAIVWLGAGIVLALFLPHWITDRREQGQ